MRNEMMHRPVVKEELLDFMRTTKWLDANNVFTDRKPSTATHAQHVVDECKTRGLI